MPLAGTIVWAILGASAPFVSELTITWMLYIGTGAIFYLGAGLSYLTGEQFFAKKATSNSFDRLFFDLFGIHQLGRLKTGVEMGGLVAIAAIFRAAAGLDR